MRRGQAVALTEQALLRSTEAGGLTLIVETSEGRFARRIPAALPLPADVGVGTGAERLVREAAATWGLPDFVFEPLVRRVGSGVRELSDGILLVGTHGAVLQVKARTDASPAVDREESWIRKAVTAAIRQANGTLRQLRSQPATLQNRRGREIIVDGASLEWVTVVLVDHPDPPDGVDLSAELRSAHEPAIALLRRDWEFLFGQLKSTHAVLGYLRRAAMDQDEVALGDEARRYYEYAAADAEAEPAEFPLAFIEGGGQPMSVPLLPQAPAGHDDLVAHATLRMVLEDVATSPAPQGLTEPDRLRTLAAIDSSPVAYREELGRDLRVFVREVRDVAEGDYKWRMRRLLGRNEHLAFVACSRLDERSLEGFRQWMLLRHLDAGERQGALDGLLSVGVLLTPRRDGVRAWDTTTVAIQGDPEVTSAELAQMRALWS